MAMKNLTKTNHTKRTLFVICITLLMLVVLQYLVLKWGDNHTLNTQQPLYVKLQSPINIQPRFALSPIPQATYIEVSEATTPQDIDSAAKSGNVPQSAGSSADLTPISKDTIRAIIRNKVIQEWGIGAWPAIDYIIVHESNYQQFIVNKSSGSCGLFQSLPCSKMKSMDLVDQLDFGFSYIRQRYGTPQAAMQHEISSNWY
jgi:hypothetical protein